MYPIDRRKMALHIYNMLHSLRKTAILLQVSHTTISRWLKNQERKKYYRNPESLLKSETIVDIIKSSIENDPFITLKKLRDLIKQSLTLDVSKELIRVAIKRQGASLQ
jgi:transposase